MTSPEPGQPGQHFPDAGGYLHAGAQQPAPPAGPPNKRTAVVVLTILAVVMLGAAGTFGTLWLLERGDHNETTQQLSTKDQQLADERKAHEGTKTKLTDSEKAKADAEAKTTALTPCADAGQQFAKLALTNASEAEATKAATAMIFACGH
jgi:uncharacterized protein HemX